MKAAPAALLAGLLLAAQPQPPAAAAASAAPATAARPATPGTAAPAATAAAVASATPPRPGADGLLLHVPSPDWRDQIVYFALTDRFDDGDPANNDLGGGEFDPTSLAHYNGGDFAGLQRRLDYIQGLGATALWITPPVRNLWWDPVARHGGYHGYWATHFTEVDPHLGTLDDYRRLSDALHRRGLHLVQDIVVNHTANFFQCQPGQPPERGCAPNAGLAQHAPSQPPFDLNDARNPAHRAAGIYHWTPDIADYRQRVQVARWQMGGLDDLATDRPVVQRALRASYGHWVREVGVDAFRVDTAFYVAPDYFHDFLYARDPAAPGIDAVARATGRQAFFSFGEGFAIDAPFRTEGAARIEAYVRGRDGQRRLPGMLNFPMYGALVDVFARGAPTAVLGHRIQATLRVHADPHRMLNFVDNHDVDRFLASGSAAALQQATLAMMTLPGIPVLYYGTEQGFTLQRAAMFSGGWGSGGRDRFDTTHPLYQATARLAALRRAHPLFSRGVPTVLATQADGPGVIAWRMQHGHEAALVVLNTADTPRLAHGLPTGLAAGTPLHGLLALQGEPTPLVAGPGGRVALALAPRSGQVWRLSPGAGAVARAAAATGQASAAAATAAPSVPAAAMGLPAAAAPRITQARLQPDGRWLLAAGQAQPGARLALVLDGDLGRAAPAEADAQGRWQVRIDTDPLGGSSGRHALVAWHEGTGQASAAWPLQIRQPWQLLADASDPAGDDHGADGRLLAPDEAGYRQHRPMDIRRLRAWQAGSALKIELTMAGISTAWKPPNGFDHVVFTLYLSQPGAAGGASVMPLQNASLPEGRRWQHRIRVNGWANALHGAEGAGPDAEGTTLTPAARVQTDARSRRVVLTLPGGSLGPREALAGLHIHATTWDYDGGYRALGPTAGPSNFGGGTPEGAKVMDSLGVTLAAPR